jgi:Sel1 repeat-containing protein
VSPRGSRSVLSAVLGLVVLLACFSFLPRVNGNPRLLASVLGAAVALFVYWFFLRLQVSRSGRTLTYEFLPRKVHYVQLLMHSSIYAYWGWYWREVYHYIPLMAAQLVFAYALDMLVCWSRRDKWILGFGPFPIILSTNLFLWFRDDWFFLQFLLVAVGILGKELIKWQRDGRLTHVFNPSSFPLFIFSIALIATHNTDISSGVQIATTFHYPPHIYGEIFVLGLIVQSLFQVTLVTLSAAASLYLLNLWYTGMTGDYQFVDSNIPVAVFLGLHLLVTDPATSPRKGFGKIVFGALYGAGVFGAYSVLKLIHAPEFYDKLLCVPPLNLTVRFLDRMSEALAAKFRGLLKLPSLRPQQANFAWMGVWISLFILMNATGFLVKGDEHPGGQPAYWAKVCQKGRADACEKWVGMLKRNCAADSSRDCLVLGEVLNEGHYATQNRAVAGVSFGRACDLGLPQGCGRLMAYLRQGGLQAMAPACDQGDGASCFILGSVFSSGQGVPKDLPLAFELFQKSCEVGWPRGCGRLGLSYLTGEGTSKNPELAISNFEKGCQGHNAASCLQAAQFYRSGKMAWTDIVARERYQRACDLGLQAACQQQALLAKSIPH